MTRRAIPALAVVLLLAAGCATPSASKPAAAPAKAAPAAKTATHAQAAEAKAKAPAAPTLGPPPPTPVKPVTDTGHGIGSPLKARIAQMVDADTFISYELGVKRPEAPAAK